MVVLAAFVITFQGGGAPSTTSSSSLVTPASVSVFGFVTTSGIGTHPTSIVFTSEEDGKTIVAQVSWPGGGHFSADLPNQEKYNVGVRWVGNYSWQSGLTSQGELSVNMSAGSQPGQSFSSVALTPDTVIRVGGAVPWNISSSIPISIRFTASDGQNFTAPVTDQKAFSIRLPNLMTYEVNIESQNTTGYTEWWYAHSTDVSAGINVVGLTVRIGQ